MSEAGYEVTHIDQIPEPAGEKEPGERDWHAVRIHFGIQSFGVNAYTAGQGGEIVGEHDELDTKHEELYYVSKGSATFTIDGAPVEAPEGTAARPMLPSSSVTSTSTVGLPRLSRIWRAWTSTIAVMAFLLAGA